mmetsp:Transcript_110108/g.312292  ORF Transcript_110108/g.312292 Transcript_110108/m.312292 type:complete len:340 (-) Transcript_110108:129-1148(-)
MPGEHGLQRAGHEGHPRRAPLLRRGPAALQVDGRRGPRSPHERQGRLRSSSRVGEQDARAAAVQRSRPLSRLAPGRVLQPARDAPAEPKQKRELRRVRRLRRAHGEQAGLARCLDGRRLPPAPLGLVLGAARPAAAERARRGRGRGAGRAVQGPALPRRALRAGRPPPSRGAQGRRGPLPCAAAAGGLRRVGRRGQGEGGAGPAGQARPHGGAVPRAAGAEGPRGPGAGAQGRGPGQGGDGHGHAARRSRARRRWREGADQGRVEVRRAAAPCDADGGRRRGPAAGGRAAAGGLARSGAPRPAERGGAQGGGALRGPAGAGRAQRGAAERPGRGAQQAA